jgi:hypothetical protein
VTLWPLAWRYVNSTIRTLTMLFATATVVRPMMSTWHVEDTCCSSLPHRTTAPRGTPRPSSLQHLNSATPTLKPSNDRSSASKSEQSELYFKRWGRHLVSVNRINHLVRLFNSYHYKFSYRYNLDTQRMGLCGHTGTCMALKEQNTNKSKAGRGICPRPVCWIFGTS